DGRARGGSRDLADHRGPDRGRGSRGRRGHGDPPRGGAVSETRRVAALFARTAAVAAALLLHACATPQPVPTRPVTITAGESVWGIVRRNGLSLEDFIR